jgi:stage III sporulation protein AE
MVEAVQAFFTQLSTFMGGMIPVMGVFYALGGNLGQAAVNGEVLMVVLAVCQYVGATVTPPVCAVCMSFSLMDAFGLRLTLSPLCDRVKQWYASVLGLLMFVFSIALSVQSVLASRADNLAMRGVKYAVGNMIPMVGGAVSGALGTVAAGVSLLRGLCGVSGVVLVMLLLLPTLVQLLLFRGILRLAATVATLLSCDGESRLLTEMASLHGYLAAAVSVSAVTFLTALGILLRSGVALG